METYATTPQEHQSKAVHRKQVNEGQKPTQRFARKPSRTNPQAKALTHGLPKGPQAATVQRLLDDRNPVGTWRPEPVVQQKAAAMETPVKNNTGLPDTLKAGIEHLSGYAMDDVKVHYNSDKPAQLQAHAYAQGTDIHIAPGQEKHLPHEAWHVVQQKQGRVQPTMQMNGANINDSPGLEKEADAMGARALRM